MNEKKSPWNELDYYKEGQKLYGRDDEIHIIGNSICQNLHTIIYGQSGIGKSSLLFAGIFPVLRKEDYFPVFLRLGMVSQDVSYVDFIIESIKNEALRVDKSIGKEKISFKSFANFQEDNIAETESEKLWRFFSNTKFYDSKNKDFIPVLVFDQFEEIFNNKDTYQKAEQFILDLYYLLDDTRIIANENIPYSNYRIVISLREDYLYTLEDIIDRYNLTELRFNKYRVRALSKQQAKDVILKTSEGGIEKNNESKICDKIIEKSINYKGEVNTLLLSLVCSTCYSISPDGIIRLDSLDNSEDYLYYYYTNKMGVVSPKTREYLEKALITNDGRRDSIDIRAAIDSGKILQEEVDLLTSSRIVRILSSSEGDQRMEFIHDKITSIINSKKQSIWQCFKHAIANMFNFNTRANIKEFKIIQIVWIIIYILFTCSLYSTFTLEYTTNCYFIVAYYIFIFFSFVYTATSIRRAHDRNVSGLAGMFDVENQLMKPSSINMYKDGSSYIMAIRRIHPYFQTMNKKEYIAANKFLLFGFFRTFLILLPLYIYIYDYFYDYIQINEIPVDELTILYTATFIVSFFHFISTLRLPAMRVSPWFGIIPIVPWLIGFYERKNESYFELNISKRLISAFTSCIALILTIYFLAYFIDLNG